MSSNANTTFSKKVISGCRNLLRSPVKEIRWQIRKFSKRHLPVEKTVNRVCTEYRKKISENLLSSDAEHSLADTDSFETKLRAFFDGFGLSLEEPVLSSTAGLMSDLYQEGFIESMDQLGSLVDFLRIVEFQPDTRESHEEAAAFLSKFISATGKNKREFTLALCLKYMFPALYDMNKNRPLTTELYFMQPRRGLNQTFRYLHHKLKKNFPWTLKLYELHRDEVSMTDYYTNAAWFIRDMATAPVVFIHESNNLMGHLDLRPETQIIQLWHGCGVLKKIGLSTAGKDGFKSLQDYMEYPEYNKYSLVTIASPELSWVFEEFMGIPKESGIIQPLGVARTDEFFDEGFRERCFEKLYKAIPAAREKKVILYAPTYRGVDPNRVSPDALDIPYFAERLSDDYILIVKHHQTAKNLPEIPEPYRDTFAYDMTRGRGMNINELMTVADICITDYSSVAFEFSLFRRPILFFVFDLEEYIDNRGLYYSFDELSPGPLCRTTKEMADYIRQIENGFDDTEITEFRDRFMCCCDGHSCERVIRYLIEKLLPVPEDFRNGAETVRKDFVFLGWNAYKYDETARIWFGTDDAERSLITTKDKLREALDWDKQAFFEPVWEKKQAEGN